jgi:ABC-2 type transport system ATP-binding protein
VILTCDDSDAALRELFSRFPAVRDIEVQGANLEAAFLALTGDPDTDHRSADPSDHIYEEAPQ